MMKRGSGHLAALLVLGAVLFAALAGVTLHVHAAELRGRDLVWSGQKVRLADRVRDRLTAGSQASDANGAGSQGVTSPRYKIPDHCDGTDPTFSAWVGCDNCACPGYDFCCSSDTVCVIDTWAFATSLFGNNVVRLCIPPDTVYETSNPANFNTGIPYGMVLVFANGTSLCTVGVTCYVTNNEIVMYSTPAPTASLG